MAQIIEDHVSFETAKLLKEKGFDEPCYKCFRYSDNSLQFYGNEKACKNSEAFATSAPTLQMAMKWLREVQDIFIEISVDEMLKDEGYQWALYYNSTKKIRPYSGWEYSYEQACEAAIKYCLEKLI